MGFAKNTEVKRTESKSLHPYKNEIMEFSCRCHTKVVVIEDIKES